MPIGYVLLWFCLFVLFVLLEISTSALVSIWFVFGTLAAMVAAYVGLSFMWQFIIFLFVSIITLILLKPFAKKYVRPKEKTNIDALIGAKAIVTDEINNDENKGQVKINGLFWRATSEDNSIITDKSSVTVSEVRGVTLIVKENKK